jgi:NAD(P)-dependent dehydrogenase (short-subunit alcohol dehydrogenase family)
LAQQLNGGGAACTTFEADIAARHRVLAAFRHVEAELGPVDVLVPNAGLGTQVGLSDIDDDLWNQTLAVNLEAPFHLAQQAVPAMAERGRGECCSSPPSPPSPKAASVLTTPLPKLDYTASSVGSRPDMRAKV